VIDTIVGALLPIVVTLLFGFFAGWHKDFDGGQAAILNRMVMLYALPLSLFAGMVATSRDQVLSQGPLALAILVGMAGGYAVVFIVSRYLFRRELMTASLQALAIAGPAVPFVGVSVLGHLFGNASAVPISLAAFVMNLIQVPATLMLLSAGTAQRSPTPATTPLPVGADITRTMAAPIARQPSLGDHIVHALREPVVWAPILALVLVLFNLHFSPSVQDSLLLLGRATGGVALFASGIVLFSRRVAVNFTVGVSVVARNIVIPAVMWGLALLLGMTADITREVVLTLAIPTASIAVILAVQYRTAEQEMASTLFFSTIFSVVTMGGFIWLTA
jgi:predicted permease